jgi:hypothetical protein
LDTVQRVSNKLVFAKLSDGLSHHRLQVVFSESDLISREVLK